MSWSFLPLTVIFQNAYFGHWRALKRVEICKKCVFLYFFNLVFDMGAQNDLVSISHFPDLFPSRYGPIWRSNDRKSSKFFAYEIRVWILGCLIEWTHGGHHMWYPDRSLNYAVSWSNRADRPISDGKRSGKCLRASPTQTLKNEKPSRAPQNTP